LNYDTYDGRTIPFADASFDAAFAVCVMHHVPPEQWQSFADEMQRVVRQGGLNIIFEHNPFNPLTRRAVAGCEFDRDAVLLKPRDVEAHLTRAGLQRPQSRYILTVPPKGSVLTRLDKIFSHLPLGAQYYTMGVK
jgi:SAM-dependent methyltransferase